MKELIWGIVLISIGAGFAAVGTPMVRSGWESLKKGKEPSIPNSSAPPTAVAPTQAVISNSGQGGGFTGVNNGTVNFGKQADEQASNTLVAGKGETPLIAKRFVDQGKYVVIVGEAMLWASELPHDFILQDDEPIFSIGENKSGLWISAKFFDSKGQIIAELVENKFFLNRDNCFRVEVKNNRLVIFDKEAVRVIDLEAINSHAFSLTGSFYLRNGLSFLVTKNNARIGPIMLAKGGALGELNLEGIGAPRKPLNLFFDPPLTRPTPGEIEQALNPYGTILPESVTKRYIGMKFKWLVRLSDSRDKGTHLEATLNSAESGPRLEVQFPKNVLAQLPKPRSRDLYVIEGVVTGCHFMYLTLEGKSLTLVN